MVMPEGTPMRVSARWIALTAPPSEALGARSKPIVLAGNCATRVTCSGAYPSMKVATVDRGTDVTEDV